MRFEGTTVHTLFAEEVTLVGEVDGAVFSYIIHLEGALTLAAYSVSLRHKRPAHLSPSAHISRPQQEHRGGLVESAGMS